MTTQFDIYQKMLNHQRMQTGLMIGQTALVGHMAGSLNHLQGEMNAIRQMNLEGLAIQQEMHQREQLQSQLEEFIYNMQKMVVEFDDPSCKQPPSVRYFTLKGVAETVQQLGVGTALIRGRDNKAAFEAAIKDVQRIAVSLEKDQDVIDAIEWGKAEDRRLANEQQKRQAEQKRISQAKEARRNELIRQISDLKNQRQQVSFGEWHQKKFGTLPLPVIAIMWLLYGFIWIPIVFFVEKSKGANSTLNGEISKLERELASI